MYFHRVASFFLYPVTAPVRYFISEPKKIDLLKDREEFLNTPFVSASRKPVAKEVIGKEFIGTVKTTTNNEKGKYLESYVKKGKDFTVELIGISNAIGMNEDFSCSSAFEKGTYTAGEKDLPSSPDILDGYFLKIVSKGQKAGFIIGTDRENLNTAKKMLEELSAKLADDTRNPEDDTSVTTFDKAIKWLKDSDYSTRGSTNNRGRLLWLN